MFDSIVAIVFDCFAKIVCAYNFAKVLSNISLKSKKSK